MECPRRGAHSYGSEGHARGMSCSSIAGEGAGLHRIVIRLRSGIKDGKGRPVLVSRKWSGIRGIPRSPRVWTPGGTSVHNVEDDPYDEGQNDEQHIKLHPPRWIRLACT